MKRLACFVLFACLLGIGPSFGIGRSGNGTINDVDLGFEADVPVSFAEGRSPARNAFRLEGKGVESHNGMILRPFLELSPLTSRFPELEKLRRREVAEHQAALGWTKLPASDPCVDIYQAPQAESYLAFWGEGKGIALFGPQSVSVQYGAQLILGSLRLLPGACAW